MSDKSVRSIQIKGGQVVRGEGVFEEDLFIRHGKICEAQDISSNQIDEVVDASGLLVFPGAIDTH
ncbi:uncharacterized protein METZ01_LOCUS320795, partial [marine metagenome]